MSKTNSLFTVVGGGISGLTAAWYLAKQIPAASSRSAPVITLIESSNRFGGWMRSDKTTLQDGTTILKEKGPRTLRLDGSRESKALLEIVDELDLHDKVVFSSKNSPASLNRYIYHNGVMNAIPGKFSHLLTRFPPVIRPAVKGVFKDLFTKRNTPIDRHDESISELIARRFGSRIDDSLLSAVMAGIYASDTKKLSSRMVLNKLWRADRISGKILVGMNHVNKDISKIIAQNDFINQQLSDEKEMWEHRLKHNAGFWESVNSSSIYSFKDGIETLSDAILKDLAKFPHVNIVSENPCVGITKPESSSNSVDVKLSNGEIIRSGKVINTTPLNISKSLFKNQDLPEIFSSTPYSSISLVNITYKGDNLMPIDGFGFLVPRESWNKTDVIGVVFDSCCLPEQDGGQPITRITAMLGGPVFNEKFKNKQDLDSNIIASRAVESVKKILKIEDEPLDVQVTICKDCIPTYTVGYYDRLSELYKWLKTWNGSLLVSGAAYGGPGINIIALHSKDVSARLMTDFDMEKQEHLYKIKATGLEEILTLY
ncbi:hypothetical protein BB558_000080 [Smittium angustum]|uniref:Protoporphyrinogen oxidase n=1 Tax=Smittium angustum TaxID=133377 RepID=A0A2U1JFL5_SMIAN|nr:hypothetical protein BB558_000080 [Smittium angustum]